MGHQQTSSDSTTSHDPIAQKCVQLGVQHKSAFRSAFSSAHILLMRSLPPHARQRCRIDASLFSFVRGAALNLPSSRDTQSYITSPSGQPQSITFLKSAHHRKRVQLTREKKSRILPWNNVMAASSSNSNDHWLFAPSVLFEERAAIGRRGVVGRRVNTGKVQENGRLSWGRGSGRR